MAFAHSNSIYSSDDSYSVSSPDKTDMYIKNTYDYRPLNLAHFGDIGLSFSHVIGLKGKGKDDDLRIPKHRYENEITNSNNESYTFTIEKEEMVINILMAYRICVAKIFHPAAAIPSNDILSSFSIILPSSPAPALPAPGAAAPALPAPAPATTLANALAAAAAATSAVMMIPDNILPGKVSIAKTAGKYAANVAIVVTDVLSTSTSSETARAAAEAAYGNSFNAVSRGQLSKSINLIAGEVAYEAFKNKIETVSLSAFFVVKNKIIIALKKNKNLPPLPGNIDIEDYASAFNNVAYVAASSATSAIDNINFANNLSNVDFKNTRIDTATAVANAVAPAAAAAATGAAVAASASADAAVAAAVAAAPAAPTAPSVAAAPAVTAVANAAVAAPAAAPNVAAATASARAAAAGAAATASARAAAAGADAESPSILSQIIGVVTYLPRLALGAAARAGDPVSVISNAATAAAILLKQMLMLLLLLLLLLLFLKLLLMLLMLLMLLLLLLLVLLILLLLLLLLVLMLLMLLLLLVELLLMLLLLVLLVLLMLLLLQLLLLLLLVMLLLVLLPLHQYQQ